MFEILKVMAKDRDTVTLQLDGRGLPLKLKVDFLDEVNVGDKIYYESDDGTYSMQRSEIVIFPRGFTSNTIASIRAEVADGISRANLDNAWAIIAYNPRDSLPLLAFVARSYDEIERARVQFGGKESIEDIWPSVDLYRGKNGLCGGTYFARREIKQKLSGFSEGNGILQIPLAHMTTGNPNIPKFKQFVLEHIVESCRLN
ncbi:hypothetical protein HYX04_02830 [Candidatus Woesearchaeota archaeon]|nr:hypothetical protein [Candidatus Woesearchaeota archaeon]